MLCAVSRVVCSASYFMHIALICSSTPSLTFPSREGCRWMGRVHRDSTNSPVATEAADMVQAGKAARKGSGETRVGVRATVGCDRAVRGGGGGRCGQASACREQPAAASS